MEENQMFQAPVPQMPGEKPSYTPALVLGILSIVFSFLFALAGDILGIIGIVLAIAKRNKYRTKAGLICSIIGLILSIISHVVGAYLMTQLIGVF